MTIYLVEGWTERVRINLLADDVAINLTGYTVELIVYNSSGTLTLVGTSGIDDPVTGTVYFDPDASDLVKGRLKARWKVIDPSGKVAFFPNTVDPDIWVISKA